MDGSIEMVDRTPDPDNVCSKGTGRINHVHPGNDTGNEINPTNNQRHSSNIFPQIKQRINHGIEWIGKTRENRYMSELQPPPVYHQTCSTGRNRDTWIRNRIYLAMYRCRKLQTMDHKSSK